MTRDEGRVAQRARIGVVGRMVLVLLLGIAPLSVHAACVGDCDGSGTVEVDNLVVMVSIALGQAPVTTCTAGDENGDGVITIDEVIVAVANAQNGCPGATPTPTSTPRPTFAAHSSVGQIYVTDAPVNAALQLRDAGGTVVQTGTADVNGSFIFRDVSVGNGYMVTTADGQQSGPVKSLDADSPPDQSFYARQQVGSGYGYLTTRDGTTLATMVYLPGRIDQGPYPTVIEYSGYDEANPGEPTEDPFGVFVAGAVGYAVVAINMRGTGCSGGAFDYFETLQNTDGYDAIEIIAAQPWVKNHIVGMVGLSYPGITQLFVAQTQPPHLAAITPLSVISSTLATLAPGGVLNSGFGLAWAQERDDYAKDARLDCNGQPCGQPWARRQIDAGDAICARNQNLHTQSVSAVQSIQDTYNGNKAYDPAVLDPLTPAKFVDKITVPVFLAGSWQDEQVGGYWATMLNNFTGTDKLHFTLVNGGHIDSADPLILARWLEFLSFYVRREIPHLPDTASLIFGGLALEFFGVPHVAVEADRFDNFPSFDAALASFESEPKVRVLFESGAVEPCPGFPTQNCLGGPEPSFERSYTQWPVDGLQPGIWYFQDGGRLDPSPPTGDGADTYIYDPSRAQLGNCHNCGDNVWLAHPPWDWQPLPEGKAVAYATDPLTDPVAMIGSASIDLWLKSTATDTDLQVTLSEIRPDGQETYVQTGWLRASYRTIDELQSTELRPIHDGYAGDIAPLPADQFVLARVELYPFGHVFHAGSRIRISVEAPGGDRSEWKFDALPADGQVINTIAHSAAYPSRLVLPVVPDPNITSPLPPSPSLRGQPCRAYVELSNTPG